MLLFLFCLPILSNFQKEPELQLDRGTTTELVHHRAISHPPQPQCRFWGRRLGFPVRRMLSGSPLTLERVHGSASETVSLEEGWVGGAQCRAEQ